MKVQASILVFVILVIPGARTWAKPAGGDVARGRIDLPLDAYRDLLQQAHNKSRPAPTSYALGKADVKVSVSSAEDAMTADIDVALNIRVYEDRWILAPVLTAGTPVREVTIDGEAVQLVTTPAGLAWSTKSAGTYAMKIAYRVDGDRNEAGYSLSIPVPQAAAIRLSATLPGREVEAAVIPAAGIKSTTVGETTKLHATIPTTNGIHISWRRESKHKVSISRATYQGRMVGDALALEGTLTVDLFTGETVALQLLPADVTLKEVLVDNKRKSILVEGEHFAALIKGRGTHSVKVAFEVPVNKKDGPPQALIKIPQVPVSLFNLALPGKKEISVQPGAIVSHQTRGANTFATFNVPLCSEVTIRWSESVPEVTRREIQANAEVYHVVRAEEGVLHVRAFIVYRVSRGQTNNLLLELPALAQVNSITAANGAVSDWRTTRPPRSKSQRVTVFLDRQVEGKLVLEASYELLLGGDIRAALPISVPLSRVQGTHRQRGMVALLATKEYALKPVDEKRLSRVGENQLPAFVRQQLKRSVAHTFKYSQADPILAVQTTTPKRKQGKVDAQVNTLISLADVALQGSARVEINVKSGTIMAMKLKLPKDINLLSLSAPSLRTHKAERKGQDQIIDLQFTQEMEGQFKIDVLYERILADSDTEVLVPTLAVEEAEVEQGRIAVEALAAVEVEPVTTDQLSSLDINELPQQLVLKTTNPILLAYKYAHVKPPYRLTLRVTRHREIDVQAATIDKGHYQTLYTRDGLAVTRARFMVRNTRKQFLKIELPAKSEVWSAFVNGQAVKPALANKQPASRSKGGAPSVLIKIINSASGFPVELIYATRTDEIAGLGTFSGSLPRPDTVVTHTVWDVYVPEWLTYRQPQSNMELVEAGVPVSGSEIKDVSKPETTTGQNAAALRITVPTSGVRYQFRKLYANQADNPPQFQLAYASRSGVWASGSVSVMGTLFLWLGVFLLRRRDDRSNKQAVVSFGLATALLAITLLYLGRSITGPVVVSILVLLGMGVKHALEQRKRQQTITPQEIESPPATPEDALPDENTAAEDPSPAKDPSPPADPEN